MSAALAIDSVRVERELAKKSLHAFVRMAFPVIEPGEEFIDGRHLEIICDHLEAAYRGEIRQLAICIPPGCMKSVITSILFPVWCWIQDPSIRFSVIGFDADLTGGRDGGKVITLLQSDWFVARWGYLLDDNDPAKTNVKTGKGGFRYATSVDGKYTGRHVHFEIGDDLLNAKKLSKVAIENLRQFRTRVAPSRLLPFKPGKPGARIYINQRLHEDDAVGQAEREEDANPGSWVFLVLPMHFEPDNACSTKWGKDWRTEEGELLWPQRFNASIMADRKAQMPAQDFAAQYQQRPVPAGGLIFNSDTFQYYKVVPARFDDLIISVDASFKDSKTSDYVCIGVVGRVGSAYYVLDCDWRRMSFNATLDAIRMMVKHWPRARTKLIEDKANGPAIIDTLKKEIPGIIPVNPEGGKEARANAVEPFFAAKNVWFPDPQVFQWAWINRLKLELLNFPLGKNDDGVDMLSQALLYYRKRTSKWVEAMKKIRGDMNGKRKEGRA